MTGVLALALLWGGAMPADDGRESPHGAGGPGGRVGLVGLTEALRAEVPQMAMAFNARVEEEVPLYRQWRELHGDALEEAIRFVMAEFLDYLETGAHPATSRVFDIAAERAEQGLPLEALQQAWRVTTTALWEWLTERYPAAFQHDDAGIRLWGAFLQFADRHLALVIDSFHEAQTNARIAAELESRALVEEVLQGLTPEQNEAAIRNLGLRARAVVVLACATAEVSEPTVGSDYSAFLKALRVTARSPVPWTLRDGSLLALVPVARDAPTRFVVEAAGTASRALRIGVSQRSPVRANLAAARQQAELALNAAQHRWPAVDLNTLSVVQLAALKAPLSWCELPDWLRRFLLADRDHDGDWEHTARALASHGGNVAAAAADLCVHPNTVYYRLAAVTESTGVDLRMPEVLADLALAFASRDFGRLTMPG